jgi:hypothetical protein
MHYLPMLYNKRQLMQKKMLMVLSINQGYALKAKKPALKAGFF